MLTLTDPQRTMTAMTTPQTPVPLASKVLRGTEWLDTKAPGWEYSIDLELLDIASGSNCILGQLQLGYDPFWANENCGDYGFDIPFGAAFGDYFVLYQMWSAVIQSRREASSV